MPPADPHHSQQRGERSPYERFLEIRGEILKYKWIASEQAGHDIGFEAGLLEWYTRYGKPGASEKTAPRKP